MQLGQVKNRVSGKSLTNLNVPTGTESLGYVALKKAGYIKEGAHAFVAGRRVAFVRTEAACAHPTAFPRKSPAGVIPLLGNLDPILLRILRGSGESRVKQR